jgi:oligopeptide/dipeptide ABC transporter ATP-binding protein
MSPLLHVETLRIAAGPHAPALVDGISLELDRGKALGLVGESGAGKTLACLALLRLLPEGLHIQDGRIRLDGQELTALTDTEIRRLRGGRIGMVLQNPLSSLNPLMRIGDQIGEAFAVHRGVRGRTALWKLAVEALRAVRIPTPEQRVSAYAHQFSGGMRQRVAIAMNIACAPDLLIADEPTTALDATIRLQVLRLLGDIRRERRMALILVTHDLPMVARFCDDVAVMYAGRIVERGPVEAIFANPAHPYTRGLIGATPRLDGRRRLATIAGQPPSPGSIASGCAFAPRCDVADAGCRQGRIDLLDLGEQRAAACRKPFARPPAEAAA